MKITLFAVKDTVIGEFSNYFVARNNADAKRIIKNSFASHPYAKDRDLYALAHSETENGSVFPVGGGAMFISSFTDIINGFDETAADPLGELPKDEVTDNE